MDLDNEDVRDKRLPLFPVLLPHRIHTNHTHIIRHKKAPAVTGLLPFCFSVQQLVLPLSERFASDHHNKRVPCSRVTCMSDEIHLVSSYLHRLLLHTSNGNHNVASLSVPQISYAKIHQSDRLYSYFYSVFDIRTEI